MKQQTSLQAKNKSHNWLPHPPSREIPRRRCLFLKWYHPFSGGVTIKILYGVDVLLNPCIPCIPSFPIGLVKAESDFIVRSVETDLRRQTLEVAVISVDAYLLLAFSDLTCHLKDTVIGILWFLYAA